MTIRQALDHVWDQDISQAAAEELLRQGGWANGERLAGQEIPALEALADGASPEDEIAAE